MAALSLWGDMSSYLQEQQQVVGGAGLQGEAHTKWPPEEPEMGGELPKRLPGV